MTVVEWSLRRSRSWVPACAGMTMSNHPRDERMASAPSGSVQLRFFPAAVVATDAHAARLAFDLPLVPAGPARRRQGRVAVGIARAGGRRIHADGPALVGQAHVDGVVVHGRRLLGTCDQIYAAAVAPPSGKNPTPEVTRP